MELSNNIEIIQHNNLIEGRHEMSACQLDVFFYLLSQVKKDQTKYQLHIEDIKHITGKEWHHNQFREATKKLGSHCYEIKKLNGNSLQLWVFSSVEYLNRKGCIEIEIPTKALPYLTNLKNNFTAIKLLAAFKLNSKFSKRVYQLCSQWKDKGLKRYDILELKEMLKLYDPKGKDPVQEKLKKISQFKERVLEVSKNEINKHTNLKIDYELEKKGRSYKYVCFRINQQEKELFPLSFEDNTENKKVIKILDELGIIRKDLVKQIIESPILTKKLYVFIYKLKTNQIKGIKNPAGLLMKTLGIY